MTKSELEDLNAIPDRAVQADVVSAGNVVRNLLAAVKADAFREVHVADEADAVFELRVAVHSDAVRDI